MRRFKFSLVLAAMAMGTVISFGQAKHVKFTEKQAKNTVLRKFHGVVVGKVALENEDGRWQYSVNIRSGKKMREVMVDAKTGKIASVEVTTAGEEDRENRAKAKKSGH